MSGLHRFTCRLCGRCDHATEECPAPVERTLVGHLCPHVHVVLHDGFQCPSGDEPVYENDTVTTTVVYRDPVEYTSHITRGCRATSEDGRPCVLHAGHQWWMRHSPGYDRNGEPDGPTWPVEPDSDIRDIERISR